MGLILLQLQKNNSTDWEHIKPAILGVILEHFQSGEPTLLEENNKQSHAEHDGPDLK